ncbi:hypothetical protein GIB67_000818, partial [Kingdonia uniflora]
LTPFLPQPLGFGNSSWEQLFSVSLLLNYGDTIPEIPLKLNPDFSNCSSNTTLLVTLYELILHLHLFTPIFIFGTLVEKSGEMPCCLSAEKCLLRYLIEAGGC